MRAMRIHARPYKYDQKNYWYSRDTVRYELLQKHMAIKMMSHLILNYRLELFIIIYGVEIS